jgi:hypothetical protein
VVLRSVAGASHNGIVEGRRALAALGIGKHEPKTARLVRGLLVGYLTYQLLGDKSYRAFADAEAAIPHTEVVDPHAEPSEPEQPSKLPLLQVAQLLRK